MKTFNVLPDMKEVEGAQELRPVRRLSTSSLCHLNNRVAAVDEVVRSFEIHLAWQSYNALICNAVRRSPPCSDVQS